VLSASGVTQASCFQLECSAPKDSPKTAPESSPQTNAMTGIHQPENAVFGVTSDMQRQA